MYPPPDVVSCAAFSRVGGLLCCPTGDYTKIYEKNMKSELTIEILKKESYKFAEIESESHEP